jgi:DNA polymerase I
MKTLVLIDGHALAYRMHFALEHTRMRTSQKEPSWAVFGFFNAIFALLRTIQPDGIAVSFDVGKVTFRNEMYDAYKANRESMPDDLKLQMGRIKEGVQALGIPIYELEGFEADDVIGTLSKQGKAQGIKVQILTGDQDSFQLVDDGAEGQAPIEVLIPPRNTKEGLKVYNRNAVFEKFGVYPEQVIDFKGLKGDTSDNIPGVPGIGDKTAAKLLAQFQTLENLYAHLMELPANKQREKLETFKDQAFLSQKLATIIQDAPVTLKMEDCHLTIPDLGALIRFLEGMEFKAFIQQAPTLLAPFLNGQNGLSTNEAPTELNFVPQVVVETPTDFNQSVSVDVLSAPVRSSHEEPKSEEPPEGGQLLLTALAKWSPDHQVITTEADLKQFVQWIQTAGVFALDLETTGLDIFQSQIVGFSLSVIPETSFFQRFDRPASNPLGLKDYPKTYLALNLSEASFANHKKFPYDVVKTAYIPVGHQDERVTQLSLDVVLNALKPILQDESTVKIVHNLKFERNMLIQAGYPMKGLVIDTMLISYVFNPERRHGLKQLASDLLHHRMQEIAELIGTGKKEITFDQVSVQDAAPYAASDAQATLELLHYFLTQYPQSNYSDLWTLFFEVENPLAHVLADMEKSGVTLDKDYLKTLSVDLESKLKDLEKTVYELAGVEFNLNSPKQVGEVLFDKLGIKPTKKTASKTAYSTDAKVLETLAEEHEVVRKLLEYRQLFKLQSTYIDNFPELINPVTKRVHTSLNQTVAATGRLSSSNPNLQNIPIRTEIGRKIRQAFVPADQAGSFLMSADYSQIELRLVAHFSEDPNLVKAFQDGADVHSATASLVFGVPLEEVTKEQRYRAKTVNFGVIYGQSAHTLSQQLKITHYEAQQFIDKYFQTYANVKALIDRIKAEAHQTGKVSTICHRVRDLSDLLNNKNRSMREFGERAAFNTPLQGSAADLMKVAMIRLSNKFQEEGLKTRMILQVHDELVLEGPKAEEPMVRHWVEWAMALDQPLKVPLVVDIHVGPSWMET